MTGAPSPATTPTRCRSTGSRAGWTAPSRPTSTAARSPSAQAYERRRQHRQGRRDAARSATDIQNAIVNVLWNPSRQLFEHRLKSTNEYVPWKEINNYYLFAVGAIPNTAHLPAGAAPVRRPGAVSDLPFYTANQVDKAAAAAGGAGLQQLLHDQLDGAVPALLVGPAQLPERVDDHERLQEAPLLEHLGAVRRRRHRLARRQRVLGRLERLLGPVPLVDPPQHPGQLELDGDRGRRRPAPPQRREGGAVADQHRLDPLHRQQPALPQRRPDDHVGRPG